MRNSESRVKKLNGWQRLWVVLSVLWIVAYHIGALGFDLVSSVPIPMYLAHMFVPPALAYGVGLTVVWIRKGFQDPPSAD